MVTRRTKNLPGRVRSWFRAATRRAPSRYVILIFVILTAVFTSLLMLPVSSATGDITPFPDALFTAVSAVSVTGLATVDMDGHWSAFGDTIVLVGFQVGGIGVLTLASILGLTITRRLGLRQRMLAASDANLYGPNPRAIASTDRLAVGFGDVRGLLLSVAASLLIIEAVLTALITPRLVASGLPLTEALWEGFYLAASSFTNTGFVPMADGLSSFATDTYLLSVLALGVFLGSIGFPVIFALYRYVVRRGWHSHRRLGLHAKLTLASTLALIVVGWMLIGGLEWANPNTLGSEGMWQSILAAGYTSVMARSGGLGILDPQTMNASTRFVLDLLMFVGGGSASTAGGIKVTTLAVLFLAAYAEARGTADLHAFGRRIPVETVRLAVSILIWGVTIVSASTVTLLHMTGESLDTVLFEVISAFGTCGFSIGLSPNLPDAGKIVLAATMWAGRVGTVTLAAAIASTSSTRYYRLPEERPIVG